MDEITATAAVAAGREREDGRDSWLTVDDLRREFDCGVSKAQLIMRRLPSIRIGRRDYVLRSDMMAYLLENGGIGQLDWPKRGRRGHGGA